MCCVNFLPSVSVNVTTGTFPKLAHLSFQLLVLQLVRSLPQICGRGGKVSLEHIKYKESKAT